MDVQFELQGLDQVLKKMRAVPKDIRLKGARFAGRKAASLIRESAIRNASKLDDPETREQIFKNIAVRFASREFRRTGDVMFRVGIMGGAAQYGDTRENRRKRRVGATYKTNGSSANPGGDTWYWRFVELGTQKAPAKPFLRPALEQNVVAATDEFTRQMNGWLDRYFRRQGIDPSGI